MLIILRSVSLMHSHWYSFLCVLLLASCATPPDSETKPMGENVLSKEAIHAAKSDPALAEKLREECAALPVQEI